jgi:hypothetical protein
MGHYRTIPVLIALIAALGGCSKENSAPATQAAAAPVAAAPAAPSAAPSPAAPPPSEAQAAAGPAPIATGETNTAGIVAEVTQCARKEGVLSIKIRFRNTGSAAKQLDIIGGRDYESYYVSAGSKKYFILKDSEGTYLTPKADGFGSLGAHLEPGGQYTWWAKYPAPPADIKSVTFYMPIGPPIEDIPVTDK